MDRRVIVIVLTVVLTLSTLVLVGMASGRPDPSAAFSVPSMSGEFTTTQFAAVGFTGGPSVHVPPDGWNRVRGIRHPRGAGHRLPMWV